MQKFERVAANSRVCEMLEQYLAHAKKGSTSFVALVLCERGNITGDFVGDTREYYAANFALDNLKQKIMAGANLGGVNPFADSGEAPANIIAYDLTTEPACFDFVLWLVNAEMMRIREGAPAPLRVAFLRRNDEEVIVGEQQQKRDGFLKNVMIPTLSLFGAVCDPLAANGRRSSQYALKPIVDAARLGEEVPRIKVPQHIAAIVAAHLGGEEVVTITLRETPVWEHRNSNLAEWIKFATWLKQKGERVVFLRDTAKAAEPIEGHETFAAGSNNLLMRAAIYEQAKCNLFVSNGPVSLAYFGSRPWLAFVTVSHDEPYEANTIEWWKKFQGILPHQRLPWAIAQQQFIAAEDTFENLCWAWEAVMEAKPVKAA